MDLQVSVEAMYLGLAVEHPRLRWKTALWGLGNAAEVLPRFLTGSRSLPPRSPVARLYVLRLSNMKEPVWDSSQPRSFNSGEFPGLFFHMALNIITLGQHLG